MQTQTLRITRLDPDDEAGVQQYVAVANAASALDSPWEHPRTVHQIGGLLRRGWDGDAPHAFLAHDGSGTAVGALEVWVNDWDNVDLAWLWLVVRPDHRRRGVGSALMEHAFGTARELGRTKLGIDGWDSSEAPAAFAARHGFAWASQAINRRQHLREVDLAQVQGMYDDAAAAAHDYELVRIEGRTPDDLIEQVAEMVAAINDAPLDELDLEDEVFPPERVRRYEETQALNGNRLYRLVARHRGSGELAGHTVVAVEIERPATGEQHDTSVVRSHRGHRLGLLLKAGMVLWLAETEPQLETVDTWNAESNDHMIAVNEQLGYRALGRGVQYQRRLA
ncbi:MAG: GNAT family N-acetyltransferase [Actinomycetes bacterium]